MFHRILVATDGSPVSERMVLYVEHLARIESAEITVLHAYEPPASYIDYAGYDQLLASYRALAQAIVDDMRNALQEYSISAGSELRLGPAADAILAAAIELDADLIVIGAPGKNSMHEFLGSVSVQVPRHARCPVLQVR